MSTKQNPAWTYRVDLAAVARSQKPLPALANDEILVENRAIGINPVDWKFIHANPLNWAQAHIPGVDGAGTVIATGDGVDDHWLGKSVAYHTALKRDGSFARYSILNAKRVMRLPEGMAFSLAAALPCPMLTAWQAAEKIPVKAGFKVLVAGMGAVNKLLVQMLVQRGFQVDVISRSLEPDQANDLGINRVFRQQEQVSGPYFAAYDAVSGDNAATLVPLLRANGHIIAIQDRVPEPLDPAFTRTISYHEIALGALHDFGDDEDWQHLMDDGESLLAQVQGQQIRVEAPIEFPFDALDEALVHSETRKRKTVVTL